MYMVVDLQIAKTKPKKNSIIHRYAKYWVGGANLTEEEDSS